MMKVINLRATELEPTVNVCNNSSIADDLYSVNFRSSDGHKCRNYSAGVPQNEEVHQL